MTLTIFFTDKCKQVINLHSSFFFNEANGNKRILSNDEIQLKAKNAAITISEDKYFSHSIEYDRIGLLD